MTDRADIRPRYDGPCTQCGGYIEQESVNVGVGVIYGPAWCLDCGADPDFQERSPELTLLDLEMRSPTDEVDL